MLPAPGPRGPARPGEEGGLIRGRLTLSEMDKRKASRLVLDPADKRCDSEQGPDSDKEFSSSCPLSAEENLRAG
jgi:hypothetical protein